VQRDSTPRPQRHLRQRTFTGLFCVNAKGFGTYTQGLLSGFGSVTVVKGTTSSLHGQEPVIGGVHERHQEFIRRVGSDSDQVRDVHIELGLLIRR